MRRICLVTDELFPMTTGGIGRILHNLILQSQSLDSEIEFHILVPTYTGIDASKVTAYFGGRVSLHLVVMRQDWAPSFEFNTAYPPAKAYTDTVMHAQSLDIMLTLKRMYANGTQFDVIEFPDYRGWAFCTLQEKLLGRDFGSTVLAIRLHTTDGILQQFEARPLTFEQAGYLEIERKALADAELVIASLPTVARFNANYYGFGDNWLQKVKIEFPPVVWGDNIAKTRGHETACDLMFPTKIQMFKRPEVFVRAAAHFMHTCPEFQGRAVLACHAQDPAYLARIRAIIPRDLESRFLFSSPNPEREMLMSHSIVVIPSAYESTNLTAYEAAAMGGTLVLNGECIAFGEETPFIDGLNCYKSDGTVEGLVKAIERAWRTPKLEPVKWAATEPYWHHVCRPARSTPPVSDVLASVIITNYNLARYLPKTLASVVASTHSNIEIILVDDASTEGFDRLELERIEKEGVNRPLRLIRNPVNRGLSAARNIGIRAARGKYILPLDADDCISPTFVEIAVRALETQLDYDVVVPSCAYFESNADLAERNFRDYALFLGDVPSLGMAANRFSTACSLMRRKLFDEYRYDETLDSFEDWALYLRLAHEGHRFLVTNDLHFFYRSRPGSMIHGMNRERHYLLLSRFLASVTHGSRVKGLSLFPLVVQAAEESRVAAANAAVAQRRSSLWFWLVGRWRRTTRGSSSD
ncbi:MAG: glycosyltransferase [Verrucomicrobiota bacterium]